jgi:hypothetical protein
MKQLIVNPVAAAVLILIVVFGSAGIWYYRTTPGIGRPGPGEPGLVDPYLSGPNSVMKGGRGGAPGTGTPANRPPGR